MMRRSVAFSVMLLLLVGSSAAVSQSSDLKPVVAVFELRVEGVQITQNRKSTLTGYLSSRLTAGGVYQVAPASSIREALIEQKKESHKDCYDQFCQIKIGQAIAANMTLSSLIWRVGNKCSLNLDLYDVRTEAMVNSVEVPGLTCDEAGLKEGIGRGAAKLSGQEWAEVSGDGGAPGGSAEGVAAERGGMAQVGLQGSSNAGGSQTATSTGALNVTGSPKGALVEIKGPPEYGRGGRGSARLPVKGLRVPAGNYTVTVAAKDYDAAERTVWVYPGVAADLSVDLEYGFGQIELTGGPAGVQGKIACPGADPMNVTLPGDGSSIKLPVHRGDCRVAFSAKGLEPFDRTVTVAAGSSVPVDVRLDPDRGIRWIRIPGGTFQMGSNDGDHDEKPLHGATVGTFELSATEVTVAQYRQCVNAGVCSPPHWDDGTCLVWNGKGWVQGTLPSSFREDNKPVVCVDWDQASEYATWVRGRLPTEAEWEYAARSGGRNQKYPWGDQAANCDFAVVSDGGYGCGLSGTWPVCSKAAGMTIQGLCDMAGNVWEWVSDWYGDYGSGSVTNPTGPSAGSGRVIRGRSWFDSGSLARSAERFVGYPDINARLGFRPARDVR